MSGPWVHFVFDIDYALRMEVISTWWLKSKKRKDGESEDEMKRKDEREDLPDSIKYAARYQFATDFTLSRVFCYNPSLLFSYYFCYCYALFCFFVISSLSGEWPWASKGKLWRKMLTKLKNKLARSKTSWPV